MADIKTTARQDFPEVTGKIVDIMRLVSESGYYAITIRFQDKTALTFTIEPCICTFPVYEDWKDGDAKIIKEFAPVRSTVLRE